MIGRLAPTPSGRLHLGNLCAFAAAWLSVRAQGGRLLLRLEDVDRERARPELADGLRRDLEWMGLFWDAEVPAQSTRDYGPWLERLSGQTYRCRCTRAQLRGARYPGTCREAAHLTGAVRFRLPAGLVDVDDRRFGHTCVDPHAFGDPVVQRRDGGFTYNLAVVADDIADGVTEVARGADLRDFTGVQIRLWEAFEASPPAWLHAPLILGPDGRKLSKSHASLAVTSLREAGVSPAQIWSTVLLWLGLENDGDLTDSVSKFRPFDGPHGPIRVRNVDFSTKRAGLRVFWTSETEGSDAANHMGAGTCVDGM